MDWNEEMRISSVQAGIAVSPLSTHLLEDYVFAGVEEDKSEVWV